MRNACLMLDRFPSQTMFSFDGLKRGFQTRFGACVSVVMYTALIIYAIAKAVTMVRLSEVSIVEFTEKGFYLSNETFTDDMAHGKLHFGFGIASYYN